MNAPVVILGASSAIGRAAARRWAASGHDLVLCTRDVEDAHRTACDITLRYGVEATALAFEAHEDAADPFWFDQLQARCGGSFEGVFLAYGAMLDEDVARSDPQAAAVMIDTNFTSALQILERFAGVLERERRGFICAVSSVAGDRGRASNYVYGATKAGLQTLLSGMRARLSSSGVRVIDVRPGFVDTRLTWGRPGVFLAATPDRVAKDVLRAIDRDQAVVYTPAFWWVIMTVIRFLPDFIFKRLSL